MKIVTVKYQDEESNWVALTFDDGSVSSVSTTDGTVDSIQICSMTG